MRINWKVRLKNPVFWAQIATLIIAPMLAGAGMSWGEITSWHILWLLVLDSIKNPVVVVAILAGIWAAVNDPTTAGFSDSRRALRYRLPKVDDP